MYRLEILNLDPFFPHFTFCRQMKITIATQKN